MGFPDITSILENVNRNLPAVWHLLTGGSVLLGFWFALRGMYQLRQYGELRTMMSVQTELKKPLLFLFIAVAMLYWPSLMHITMQTFFNNPNPIAYDGSDLGNTYNRAMGLVGNIIQIVGFLAFIRGWVLLTAYGEQSTGQPVLGKAITHIIGGVLALNIFETWQILKNTFGI